MPKEDSIYTHTALCAAFAGKFGAEPDCGEGVRRDGFGNDRERLLRALTWFERAENANSDDGKVLSAYIALNSLFGRLEDDRKPEDGEKPPEWSWVFVRKLIKHDGNKTLLAFVRKEEEMIVRIINNRYLLREFWQSAFGGGADWQAQQRQTMDRVKDSIRQLKEWRRAHKKNPRIEPSFEIRKSAARVLINAISRVRVLRNQMVHGACCYGDNYNRSQMRDCAAFLLPLVGRMIKIMLSAKDTGGSEWGEVPSPPQGVPDDAQNKTAKPLGDN